MKHSDKGAIITGATSGIGSATALLFAEEGANVARKAKIYYKVVGDKPEIFVDSKTQSDIWVVEKFDQKIE